MSKKRSAITAKRKKNHTQAVATRKVFQSAEHKSIMESIRTLSVFVAQIKMMFIVGMPVDDLGVLKDDPDYIKFTNEVHRIEEFIQMATYVLETPISSDLSMSIASASVSLEAIQHNLASIRDLAQIIAQKFDKQKRELTRNIVEDKENVLDVTE